ncbi:MAG: DUF177 domain-containing protein [Muribaculaceae bacterium]|nr:DUF177 domain-containing protein [Muribaculaceae bacterium]
MGKHPVMLEKYENKMLWGEKMSEKLINWKIMYNFAPVFNRIDILGKFSKFKLPLKVMPVGSQEFDYQLDKQFFVDMESADIHDAELDVHVVVTNNGVAYDLNIGIKGEVTLLCDRCLDSLPWVVDTDYHIMVKYGEDYNDDSDDLLVIPESDNYLNVSYMIYETVVLSIPIKHTHPKGQCNRAMSDMLNKHRAYMVDADADMEDGGDEDGAVDDGFEDIDPRWNELKKLTDNN